MMNGLKRGALIVFEGCDRSGKTTQCNMLKDRLSSEGTKVEFFKFPNRSTTIGEMIDNYLKQKNELDDHTIHLLFSANRWESFQKMKQILLSGTTLVVDRYAYSGIAFTAAKGLELEWCRQPDIGLIKPDKVIYMNVSSENAAGRAQFGDERYEKQDFQNKVKDVFSKLEDPDYWQIVNGDFSKEEVHQQIYDIVMPVIESAKEKSLKPLWVEGQIS